MNNLKRKVKGEAEEAIKLIFIIITIALIIIDWAN